jgi:hypothetical protein
MMVHVTQSLCNHFMSLVAQPTNTTSLRPYIYLCPRSYLFLMPFTFNFTFSVPGIPNPFAAASSSNLNAQVQSCAAQKSSLSAPTVTVNTVDTNTTQRISRPPFRHGTRNRRAPSPLPPAPLSRKRGWVPSSSEPSYASAIQHSSIGYLDTPAKYRQLAENFYDHDYNTPDQDEMEGGKSSFSPHSFPTTRAHEHV